MLPLNLVGIKGREVELSVTCDGLAVNTDTGKTVKSLVERLGRFLIMSLSSVTEDLMSLLCN